MACAECFVDPYLKDFIEQDGQIGECSYCDAQGVKCINDWGLSDLFDNLLALYDPLEIGFNSVPGDSSWDFDNSLAELVDEDWRIFSDSFPSSRRDDLLDNIFNGAMSPKEKYSSGVPVRDQWARREESFAYVGVVELWDKFASHIKRHRRFVFLSRDQDLLEGIDDPKEWLPSFLNDIRCEIPQNGEVFRARREELSQQRFPITEMSAPPADRAPAGRANSSGIPVLYAALDRDTVVAEVRPWKGATVSVARGVAKRPLQLVDLAEIPYLVHGPFAYQNITDEVEKLHMVLRLASELARPLSPYESDIEYIPTQYLTEVVRAAGFDGMVYPSAMGKGKNLVIFDPDAVQLVEIDYVEIKDVSYRY